MLPVLRPRFGRLLARRAEAEIGPGEHQVAGLNRGREVRRDGSQAVPRQLGRRQLHKVAWGQQIGVDRIAEDEGAGHQAAPLR